MKTIKLDNPPDLFITITWSETVRPSKGATPFVTSWIDVSYKPSRLALAPEGIAEFLSSSVFNSRGELTPVARQAAAVLDGLFAACDPRLMSVRVRRQGNGSKGVRAEEATATRERTTTTTTKSRKVKR